MFLIQNILLAFYQQNQIREYEEIVDADYDRLKDNLYDTTNLLKNTLMMTVEYQTFLYFNISKRKVMTDIKTVKSLYQKKEISSELIFLIHKN